MESDLHILFVPQDFQCFRKRNLFSAELITAPAPCVIVLLQETKADGEKWIAETEENKRTNVALCPDRNPMK